jgi:divalent metal cation (Fe/Co/Zn/Cd) transporter
LVYLSIRLIVRTLGPLVDTSVLDQEKVREIVGSVEGVLHCHHIRSRGEEDHFFLYLNIHLPGQISLHRAHDITHEVEAKLKKAFPGLVDVVIHTEPHGHMPCSKE